MYDRLLVPTDGSGPANAALELASRVASPTATVHVLVVTDDDRDEDSRDESDQTVEAILADARETAAAEVKTVVTEGRHGDPRERILEYVATAEIELVVMGAHAVGRTSTAASSAALRRPSSGRSMSPYWS